mmetsp:Transcript_24256/g.95501  ORF Transcript_24256/g.95501 Transcript_24256/m.95501 type:complete len:116 (-) Transcript_24256:1165-1512(-)
MGCCMVSGFNPRLFLKLVFLSYYVGLLPRLPASMEPGITTFSGGADIGGRRGRSMSSRSPEEREIRARLDLNLVQGKGEVSSARKRNQKEPQDKYEKLKLLRKQMKEGAFSQTSG